MNKILTLLILLFVAVTINSCNLFSAVGLSSQGQPTKEVTGDLGVTDTASTIVVDHSSWDVLLKKYVDAEGFVDYKGFLNDKESLISYLQLLSENEPSEAWSVQELLAYYINTYNAYTVNLILDNYPLKSIKDLSGPWTKAIIPIGNNKLSLGGLENGILRKMNEPRIHFAINCASYSCPMLLNEAFTVQKIDEQLEKVTVAFINSDKNEITPTETNLSSIFDWYKKDFKVNGEVNVVGYINNFSKIKINELVPLKYKEYNWGLNEKVQ